MRRRLLWALAAPILFWTFAPATGAAASEAEGVALSGTLTQFGEPLANVRIVLTADGFEQETETAADGTFAFPGVPPGMYTVKPLGEEITFLPAAREVRVADEDVAGVDFRSVPFPMPTPKMDPALGKALPLGGGPGYSLTPAPEQATRRVEAGDARSLLAALREAQDGDLIYLPPGEYVFDDPALYSRDAPIAQVPAGVTLFGVRDESIIRTLPVDDVPVSNFTLFSLGDRTRLSGLTIIGPDTETGPLQGFIEKDGQTIATAYYKPIATGVVVTGRSEIDNISITGFPHVAILVSGPAADAFVHHSYIAENVRTGLGYGVKPINGAYVEVAYTKFYRNRHSMDSTGGSYYVHDSLFDSENPMGVGMIFQHAQEMSGLIVIQDNTIVNGVRGIHMFAGHGVVQGNVIDTSHWGIALRRAAGADRHGTAYKGFLHGLEVFDNEVKSGAFFFEGIQPGDNVFLDGVNVGNLLHYLETNARTVSLEEWRQMAPQWRAQVPATYPRIEFTHLPADRPAAVRGRLPAGFTLHLPPGWSLERVEVAVNDQLIYAGPAVPGPDGPDFDTTRLPDGLHELTVTAHTRYGQQRAAVREKVSFQADNYWQLTDELQPPLVSAWFGSINRSRTSAESEGWVDATGDRADFFGDDHRKVPPGPGAFLVWETPRLLEFTAVVFTRTPDAAGAVLLQASPDGETWTGVAAAASVSGPSDAGWYRIEYRGSLDPPAGPAGSEANWFRLLVRADAPDTALQVGRVDFRGFHPADEPGPARKD